MASRKTLELVPPLEGSVVETEAGWLKEADLLRVEGEALMRTNAAYAYKVGDWWNRCKWGDDTRKQGAGMIGIPYGTLGGYAAAARAVTAISDRSEIAPSTASKVAHKLEQNYPDAMPKYLEMAKRGAGQREVVDLIKREFEPPRAQAARESVRREEEAILHRNAGQPTALDSTGCQTNIWKLLEGIQARLIKEADLWEPTSKTQVRTIRRQMIQIAELLDRKMT